MKYSGCCFEARNAAGPGVLVVCRGRETADLLGLAIGAGCRSMISFGVAGGLAPDLIPGDCVGASAIIDYPAVRPTELQLGMRRAGRRRDSPNWLNRNQTSTLK